MNVTFKIPCMLMAAYLCISSKIKDNNEVSAYWMMVCGYWCLSILGG